MVLYDVPRDWFLVEPIKWISFRKLCFLVQLAGAGLYLYFSYRIPPPGLAIAVLGLMAGVMAFRAEAKDIEKVCWLAVIFCLMILEMVAIGREHQRQNETAETIIRQGVKTLEAINDLRHVPPKESNPAAVPPPPVAKPRSFLDIAPYELGIDSTQGNLFVNVACVNVGPDLIRLLDCGAMVFIHDNTTVGSVNFAVDKAAQEQYFARFIRENKAHVSPRSLIPGNFIWFSPSGPLATPQLIEDLNKNKKTLVVIGQAVYKDDHTVHKNEECEWMQPPVTSPKPVWVPCLVHNGELLSSH